MAQNWALCLPAPLVPSLRLTGTSTGAPLLPRTGSFEPKWSSPYLRPLVGEREWVNAASWAMGATELLQGSEGGAADTEKALNVSQG